MKSIEFYYDFGSPTAYLAWTQMEKADLKKFNIEYNQYYLVVYLKLQIISLLEQLKLKLIGCLRILKCMQVAMMLILL